MFRSLTAPLVLAAAVGVPYLATQGPAVEGLWPKKSPTNTAEVPPPGEITTSPQGPGATLYPTTAPLEGLPSLSLAEVFRFDVTKEWVYQRWARKSTALSELGLYGIRVPLVTGTQLHDLAGSLTYYFSASSRVERISFTGRTGDTTQLVLLMNQRYGLAPQATPVTGEQLLQMRRGDLVISELRTEPAPVLWANAPHDSFAVELTLQRPDATTPLPPRAPIAVSQQAAVQQKTAQSAAVREDASGGKDANKEESLGWKVFFPRSRVPKSQIENLNRGDQFR